MSDARAAVTGLTASLAPHGFDIVTPLRLEWYNNDVASIGAGIKEASPARGGALTIIIGNTKALWPKFVGACCENERSLLKEQAPLDRYSERCIDKCVRECFGSAGVRVFHAHRRTDDLSGNACYVAMQKMARAAGLAALEETVHLSVHPVYGPWFSLRAAVVIDTMAYDQPSPPPAPLRLRPEDHAKAKAAMESALATVQGASIRGALHTDVKDRWKVWCAARESLHPDHPYRYSERQLEYHYTSRKHVLVDCVNEVDPIILPPWVFLAPFILLAVSGIRL